MGDWGDCEIESALKTAEIVARTAAGGGGRGKQRVAEPLTHVQLVAGGAPHDSHVTSHALFSLDALLGAY